MAIIYEQLRDVGPKLAPADPYAAARAAAQAAGAAASRASAAVTPSARSQVAAVSSLSTPAKIAIGGGVAALLILVVTRRG